MDLDLDLDLCRDESDFGRAPAFGDNGRCRSRNVVVQTSSRTDKFGPLDSVFSYSLRSLLKSNKKITLKSPMCDRLSLEDLGVYLIARARARARTLQ